MYKDMLRRMSLVEVKDILKTWREDNTRKSDEIIEHWEDTIRDELEDLGEIIYNCKTNPY